jgi:hypothetical protein
VRQGRTVGLLERNCECPCARKAWEGRMRCKMQL